jgi:tetratricopeptide (TPR) repeat protein/DNA-binding winged helix-turn-helix (wHTH) protein
VRSPAASRILRFGVFEAELHAGELRKQGMLIKLQEQPFQVLAFLLEHAGEIVTRDQLRQRLWPADTFVDVDNSVNAAINRLREALGDSAESPRFVETLPRRGYRFIAPVTDNRTDDSAVTATAPVSPSAWLRYAVTVGAILLVAAGITLWLILSRPVLSFAAKDWVLITDFENQTGEARFDKALLTAFTVSLEQSQHTNVFPRSRFGPVLKRMGKTGEPKIDEILGREICLRENLRGMISASITRTGQQYAIAAHLVDPQTGNPVRSYSERALTESSILDALDALAAKIRRDLGESRFSIQQSNRPLPQVTTPSLEALQKYSEASALWNQRKSREAIQLYQDALKSDPDFAMAHAALGAALLSHVFSRDAEGKEHYEKALRLSGRTTDRERQLIEAHYQDDLGHLDQAIGLFQRYLKDYPDDSNARSNLAYVFMKSRRLEEAIEGFKEVLRIDSRDGDASVKLATCYVISGKYAEALPYYSNAFALEPSWVTWANLNHEYGFALIGAGQPGRAREVFELAVADPVIHDRGLRSMALLDLYEGRYKAAKSLLQEAILANQAEKHLLAEARNHLYLSIAFEGEGNLPEQLLQLDRAANALSSIQGAEAFRSRVGAAYARAGAVAKAAKILDQVRTRVDPANLEDASEAHRLEGEIELARGHQSEAVEKLQLADRERRTGLTSESLANAYEKQGDREHAVSAYEAFVTMNGGGWLGWEPQQSWIRAHNQLARLYLERGQKEKAREQLGALLSQWKNADPNIPLLKEAAAEIEQLK